MIFSSQKLESVEICMLDERMDYMVASKRLIRQLQFDIKIGNVMVEELFESVVKIVRWRKSLFWDGWARDRVTICFSEYGVYKHNAENLEFQASRIPDIPLNLEYRPKQSLCEDQLKSLLSSKLSFDSITLEPP